MAMFCRAENNKLYLHKKVYLKPGFLGKWVEFVIHD